MRLNGHSTSSEKIYPKKYEQKLPVLTCSICGQNFYYRGTRDAPYVKGSTYNPDTGEYEPTGSTGAICSECEKKYKGGPLDGKTVGEVILNERN